MASNTASTISPMVANLRKTWQLFSYPGSVVEIRAMLRTSSSHATWEGYGSTISGYFDDEEAFIKSATELERTGRAKNIYLTINPVNSILAARAYNRLIAARTNETTSDKDIVSRRWMIIDFDPIRPEGISATEEELNAAIERSIEVEKALTASGWPQPIRCRSGNGVHLIYCVELPNDEITKDLIADALRALQVVYGETDKPERDLGYPVETGKIGVKIDTTMYNAARITKLYGTMARKGDNLPARPHRQSYIESIPMVVTEVTAEQIDAQATIYRDYDRAEKEAKEAKRQKELEARGKSGQGISIIDGYNNKHRIENTLGGIGFTTSKKPNRMSRPGNPDSDGVRIFPDDNQSYHYSDGDLKELKIGKRISPFDVLHLYIHKGDFNAAFEAAKRDLGLWVEKGAKPAAKQQAAKPTATAKPVTTATATKPAPKPRQEEAEDREEEEEEEDFEDEGDFGDEISEPPTGKVYTNGTNGHHAPAVDEPTGPANLEEIINLLHEIRDSAELTDAERNKRVIRELTAPISDLDLFQMTEVQQVLLDKRLGFTKTGIRDFFAACTRYRKEREKQAKKAMQRIEHAKRQEKHEQLTQEFGGIEIQCNNRQIKQVYEEAMAAILLRNAAHPTTPIMYTRGGKLVRITKDEDELHVMQTIGTGGAYQILGQVARWINIRSSENGSEQTDVFPPLAVAQVLCNSPEWPGISTINAIVSTPVFGKRGVFHSDLGFNPNTRLYYTGGVTLGDMKPTSDNITAAKNLILNDMLFDFPFKDEADVSHAVALLLLPFVRHMIDGPTPLHLVDSPTPGTGKGKLVNVCGYVALGHDVPTMTELTNDDEWRKSLTTFMMGGKSHICIDNVSRGLDSGVLANALTQPYWSDRSLGSLTDVSIKILTVWVATGNNMIVSEELARRCILIRLDSNTEKPWERDGFLHENLMEWVRENRDALVTACCTLINAWVEAGMPKFKGRAKGSYESWASIIGGILDTAGITGFLSNETEAFNKAVSSNQLMADFVRAWWEKYYKGNTPLPFVDADGKLYPPDAHISSHELFKLASFSDNDAENAAGGWLNLLGDVLGTGKQRARESKLGGLLSQNTDKVIAGCKIVRGKIKDGRKYYGLMRIMAEEE